MRAFTVGLILLSTVFLAVAPGEEIVVTVDTTNLAQVIDGFGASLTDSSAWLLRYGVPATLASNVLKGLFSPTEGIGLSVLRQPMGASDFRMQDYTYDDMPAGQTDYALTNFSIAYETNYIIPLLRQIANVQTNLKVIGTPWSPPSWMKTSTNLYYGSLKTNAFPTLAAYFRKYVQAYSAAGIPIYAVTLQNEPGYQSYTYPSMTMSPTQQTWLAKLTYAEFASNGIATKILIYDHNWDQYSYPLSVLSDTSAAACIAGVAWHGYAGDPSVQSLVRNAYPSKEIYFTESSGGAWSGSFTNSLMWDAENLIIGALRHWARTVIKWNLVLDQNGGPKLGGGCETCRGILTINTNTLAVTTNSEFYALAHVSKFLKPGARRVETREENNAPPRTVAFVNPDNTYVLVAYNPALTNTFFTFRKQDESFVYALPRQSMATFTWSNAPGATVSVWLTTADKTRLLQLQTNFVAFAPRRFTWKGRTWTAADTPDLVSGNLRSPACVYVDTNGNLRIAVKPMSGYWFSGALASEDSPGFGTYRWYVVGRPDLLHTNVVANWGTYADSFHALETEFAPAYDDPPTNLFFTVQPYYLENHRYAGAHALTGTLTTWEMRWTPRRAEFRAWYGHTSAPPSPAAVFAQWNYEGTDVPNDTNETIRMSLWMFNGWWPSATQELVFADFVYTPATGSIFRDDFEDGALSNMWQTVGASSGTIVESSGLLSITPPDTNAASCGVRTSMAFPCSDDGFTRTFSFRLTDMTVTQDRAAGGVDIWAYQAILSGSNALYDVWSASNAVTLRVGLDASSNQLAVELFYKTNQTGTWGESRFLGVIANASNFFDAAGLDVTLTLTYSNYAVTVTRGGNAVAVTTISGSATGSCPLIGFAQTHYMLGAQNRDDGRGSVRFGEVEGILSATLISTAGGGADGGMGSTVVQVGSGNPATTWRAPVDSTYTRHRASVLYRAEDMGRSGTITQMWINVLKAPNMPLSNFTVRLQHTTLDALPESYINSGWTTARCATLTIPTNFSGWFPLGFSTSFVYDARSNLLVDFVFSNATKASAPIPATTWSPVGYSASFVVSADRNDPFTWSSAPSGKKYYFYGARIIDARFAFINEPPIPIGSNLSFEAGPPGFLTNLPAWSISGSPYAGAVKAGFATHGNQSLKLWKNGGTGDQSVYQDFIPSGTNSYVLTGYILSQSGEPFEGLNAYGALRLEWFGTNGLLTVRDSQHFTSGFEYDVWHAFSVTGTPPLGTTSGRFSCVLVSSEDQKGSLFFDRLNVAAVAPINEQTETPPTPNTIWLQDDFNDASMSNIWQYTGNWADALFQESNGLLRVRPGTNAWQSSGYVSVQPITWNNTSSWYVFSASLATVRVDQASGTNDIEVLLGICSQPDNPWWVTNSCGLYGYYDATADRMIVQLLLKTDRPAQSGTERFNATISNVSRVLDGTNRLVFSIALGQYRYGIQINDAQGRPVSYVLNNGEPRGWHNLGEKLCQAYWLVGAQADWTKRGDVFWDETRVYSTESPALSLGVPSQLTDGRGHVAIPCAVSDVNGESVRLFVEASTNQGASWFQIRAAAATGTYSCVLVTNTEAPHFVRANTTNLQGYVVSNQITILWDTISDGLNGKTCSNVLLRARADDMAVSTGIATTAPFGVDNEAPSAEFAVVIVESNAAWTFNSSLHVSWYGFSDSGSGITGYYAALSNGGGTTAGLWCGEAPCFLENPLMDTVNTVFVWAQDARGNIGEAASGSVVVLSAGGDFDADGLPNATETTYSCDPTNPDTDGDNMPDGWEVQYGFMPLSSEDAHADSDGDGYDNHAEFVCGTDPTNGASTLVFQGEAGPAQAWVIRWSATTGKTYTIYSTADLKDPWSVEPSGENLIGTQGLMTWTARNENVRGHYRLRIRKTE